MGQTDVQMRNSDPFDTGGVDKPRRGEILEAVSAKTSILGVRGVESGFHIFGSKEPP